MLSKRNFISLSRDTAANLFKLKSAVEGNTLFVWLDDQLYEFELPPIEDLPEGSQKVIADEERRNPGSGRQWVAILSGTEDMPGLIFLKLGFDMIMEIMADFVAENIK